MANSPRVSPGGNPSQRASEVEEGTALLPDMEAQRRRGADLRRQNSAAAPQLTGFLSRRFMSGCAILFPIVATCYVTWWVLELFDSAFSPVYEYIFGFRVWGLGFLTAMGFILATGVLTTSWIGSAFLGLGEYIIRKLPLVKHLYSAAKQVSTAVSPDNEAPNSFRECVIIRHPRREGQYALAFITGQTTLQGLGGEDLELFTVYVPTNHVYVGDVFLMGAKEIIRNNLSVREGIEIIVSVGMAVPRLVQAIA